MNWLHWLRFSVVYWLCSNNDIQHLRWGHGWFLPILTPSLLTNQKVSPPYKHIHFTHTHEHACRHTFMQMQTNTHIHTIQHNQSSLWNNTEWRHMNLKKDNIPEFHPSTFMDILLICNKMEHQLVMRHHHFETQLCLLEHSKQTSKYFRIIFIVAPCIMDSFNLLHTNKCTVIL